MQAVWPVNSLKVFTMQSLQSLAFTTSENLPAAQATHPSLARMLPTGQSWLVDCTHLLASVEPTGEVVPVLHVLHDVCATVSWYVPTAQSVQISAFALFPNLPAAQAAHPLVLIKLPTAQSKGPSFAHVASPCLAQVLFVHEPIFPSAVHLQSLQPSFQVLHPTGHTAVCAGGVMVHFLPAAKKLHCFRGAREGASGRGRAEGRDAEC